MFDGNPYGSLVAIGETAASGSSVVTGVGEFEVLFMHIIIPDRIRANIITDGCWWC